jgi:LPS-assembly protein
MEAYRWTGATVALLLMACLSAQPAGQQAKETVEILQVKTFTWQADGSLQAEQIEARWRDYLLQGTRMEGSTRAGSYRFTGEVLLKGNGVSARGEQLLLNTSQRYWELWRGSAQLEPAFLDNRLLDSLYLRGEQLQGRQDKVQGEHLQATTCSLEHPHYLWDANSMEATSGKRAILRQVRFKVLGRTLFTLPYVVVPLRETGEASPLPETGFSEEEGFYLKYAIAYLLMREATGSVRFDLMQRKGLGINLQQLYPRGTLNLYFLRDRTLNTTSLTGRLQHQQPLGNVQTSWSADYRRNSYLLFADSEAWSVRTDWLLPSSGGQTRLSFSENRNRTGAFEGIQRTLNLSESRTQGRWRWNLSGDYLESASFTGGNRAGGLRQWNTTASIAYDLSGANLQLEYQRLMPVGGAPTFFGGLERLPELSLTALARWWGLKNLDGQLRLSFGRFAEGGATRLTRERLGFEWQGRLLTPREKDSGRRTAPASPHGTAFTWLYSFRQTFYSDNTAQYLLQSVLEQRVGVAPRSSLALRWNYLRPYGYSPLGMDRTGTYNLVSADLRFEVGGGWSLSAVSAYDLLARKRGREAWNPLNLNLEYSPAEWLRWRTQSTYDLNRGRFTSLLSDLLWRFGDSRLVLSARYDPQRSRWGSVYARLDALKWGRVRLSSILQYNGYLNRFEGRHLLLTYDLHCAELEVRYLDNPFGFRQDRGVQVFLRLKALPSLSRFGYGQFGQPLGGIGSEL